MRVSLRLTKHWASDDMKGRLSHLLKTLAKWILFTSVAVFAFGFIWIFAAAPCSNIGIYILFSSVALTALSAVIMLARALLVRTAKSFGFGAMIAFYAFIEFAVSCYTALMFCRGV